MKLVIVSGLSGSGKSVALHTLEDLGYYALDNLPVRLLPALVGELHGGSDNRIERTAAAVDVRVTIENLAPADGTFITPVWVAFHDGHIAIPGRQFLLYLLAHKDERVPRQRGAGPANPGSALQPV